MPEERAINPYDFIPFGKGPARKPLEDYYSDEPLCGWFDVMLNIRTPLIIPDAAHPDKKDVTRPGRNEPEYHKRFKFYHDKDGNPTIPGSSLRGMLRSVYEAATDSCLPFLLKDDPKHPISQRTPLYAAFKNRGLLCYDTKTGVWSLYSAKAAIIETTRSGVSTGNYENYTNGQNVCFAVQTDGSVSLGSGAERGWLQFNIPVDPDNAYHVAVLKKNKLEHEEKESDLADGEVSMYQSLYTAVYDTKCFDYNRNLVSTMRDLKRSLESVKKNGGAVPCYYFIVERDHKKLVYLSGAAVGRVRQRRRWPDVMGRHSPCDKLNSLCPACALFGTIKDKGTAGHLAISDAEAITYSAPTPYTLPILATPRTSSFEFYLRKPHPDATYWNFDYYGVRASYSYKMDGETKTVSYTDYRDLQEATPRGRKMYWHGQPKTSRQETRLNDTMEAIDSGSFRFRIAFDRITREQLGDLLWCVTLGENDPKGNYCHKLGHGKPVGYGSVKLTVDQVQIREVSVSSESGFSVKIVSHKPGDFSEEGRESDLCAPQEEAILAMTDFRAPQENDVAYLTGWDNAGRETIYAWFSENRKSADDVLTLPEPMDEDLTLLTRRGRRPARGPNPRGRQPQRQAQRPPAPQRGGGRAEKAPPQAAEETARKDTAASDFNRERARYPIGTEIEVKVQKVVGSHRLFFKLEGVPYQATAVFTSGRYWVGKSVKIRITGTGQNKEGFPNFVAEIVS